MSPCFTASASPPRILALGQGRQGARIGDHRRRRMERADQVLALRRVHAGLAAHRRVQHGEQRGRHLEVRDAAQVRRGDEPGEVARDAAAERDDAAVAPEALRRAARR